MSLRSCPKCGARATPNPTVYDLCELAIDTDTDRDSDPVNCEHWQAVHGTKDAWSALHRLMHDKTGGYGREIDEALKGDGS